MEFVLVTALAFAVAVVGGYAFIRKLYRLLRPDGLRNLDLHFSYRHENGRQLEEQVIVSKAFRRKGKGYFAAMDPFTGRESVFEVARVDWLVPVMNGERLAPSEAHRWLDQRIP